MKKTIMFVAALAMVAFAAVSCKKDKGGDAPKAAFEYEVEGLTVTLTSTSTGASTCTWELGNGETATGAEVEYTYEEAGTYTVVLTAKNEYGENKATADITVEQPGVVMVMDGDFADWQQLIDTQAETLVTFANDPTQEWDKQGLKAIWYYTDETNLYFYMTYVDGAEETEINNSFAFYIDQDGDPTTGKDRSGYWANIGAEYLVEFGDGDGEGGWNDWTVFNMFIYPEGDNIGTYSGQPIVKGTKGSEKAVEGKIMLAYFAGKGDLNNSSRIGCRSCEPGWSKAGGLPAIYIIEGESTTQDAPALKFAN